MDTSELKYKVRAGTIDYGREYEFKMSALLCLRCILQNCKDMWIASNMDGVGAFDDVILYIDGVTYMVQLKHKQNPKYLMEQEFLAAKGDFALRKYFTDIMKLYNEAKSKKLPFKTLNVFNNIYFVLYTNSKINKCQFWEQSNNNMLEILNTGIDNNMYHCNTEKLPDNTNFTTENCTSVYLFTNQIGARNLDGHIVTELRNILKRYNSELSQVICRSIAEKFVKFITDWAKGQLGGYYCLTKSDIIRKLSELFFSQFELNLGQRDFNWYTCPRKEIWNKVLLDKIVTITNSDESTVKFLCEYVGNETKKYCNESVTTWGEHLSQQDQISFYQKHTYLMKRMLQLIGNRGKITMLDVYKCLWLEYKLPLVLEVNSIYEFETISNLLHLANFTLNVIVIKNGFSLFLQNDEIKYFQTLQDLNANDQNEILEQTVELQGRMTNLKSCLDNDMFSYVKCDDIIRILNGNFNIGNEQEFLPRYFIERTLSMIFVSWEVLSAIKNEIFVVEGWTEKYASKTPQIVQLNTFDFTNKKSNKTRINGLIFVSNQKVSTEKIKQLLEKFKTIVIHHLIICNENHLGHKWSYGSTKAIEPFQYVLECSVLDNYLTNHFTNTTTIISAPPGMGKSTLMNMVANEVPSDKWVFRIDLNKHRHYYKQENCKMLNSALAHLNYFKDALFNKWNCNTKLACAVIQKYITTRNIVILLDGFDEISVSHGEEVINIAKSLIKESYCVWITTRPGMKTHLENRLKNFSVILNQFTENNQKEFLIKYFSIRNDDLTENTKIFILEFVQKLLQAAKNNLNDRDAEFMGIPLQTQLLADAFNDDCRNYLLSGGGLNFNENFNLLSLYQSFIDRKIDIVCSKYGVMAQDMGLMLTEHQSLLALKLLFPLHGYVSIKIDKQFDLVLDELENYYRKEAYKINFLQKEGIVMIDEKFNITFVHRTFAEYVAAQWLYENMSNIDENIKATVNILCKERFAHNYKFLFNIFDRMLADASPIHVAIINGQINEAKIIISSSPKAITALDKADRSLMHLIAIYGVIYPQFFDQNSSACLEAKRFLRLKPFDKDNLLILIQHVSETLNTKTDLFGYTPLDYAFANRSLTVANTFHKQAPTIIRNVPLKYKEDYLAYCIVLNYDALFIKLLEYFTYRDLLIRYVNKNTTMADYFKAMFNLNDRNNEIIANSISKFSKITVSELLSSTKYYYDFSYLVSFGSDKTIRKLKFIDVNVTDVDNNTVLHYAVLHRNTTTINLLLNKGADVDKSNSDGNTPLHLLFTRPETNIKWENFCSKIKFVFFKTTSTENIAKLLILKAKNVNKQNNNGDTPLHLALLERDLYCSKLLLNNYVDINLKNKYGRTVLHYAINTNCAIIHEILHKGANINEQDNDGNTCLHLAIMENKSEIVQLLQRIADVNLQNNQGQTALHCGARMGSSVMDQILMKINDVNKQDNKGNTSLHLAVRENKPHVVDLLLSRNASIDLVNNEGNKIAHFAVSSDFNISSKIFSIDTNINSQNNEGNTPLHLAVMANKVEIVKLLKSKRANVSIGNKNNENPIHCAAKLGSNEIVKLLSENCTIYTEDSDGNTSLHLAVLGHKINTFKVLNSTSDKLQESYNNTVMELIAKGWNVNKQNSAGNTPLILASLKGQLDAVKLLIANDADVNIQNKKGHTALYWATKNRYDNIVYELLVADSNVDVQDKNKNTALHLALIDGRVETTMFLIRAGASVNIPNFNGETQLHNAARSFFSDTVFEILCTDTNPNIDAQGNEGNTPLHIAAKNGKVITAKFLISIGANVNVQNHKGETPLHCATQNGYCYIVLELCKVANVDVQDKNGNTALHIATMHGQLITVILLLIKNANVNKENRNGKLALHYAACNCYTVVMRKLLYANSDVNKQDHNGDTSLHLALQEDHIEAVELLLDYNADVDIVNSDGNTALHYAAKYGYGEIVLYGLSKGSKDKRNRNGDTALTLATNNNHADIVDILQSYNVVD